MASSLSTAFKLIGLKRKCVTESVLTFNLAWNDLDRHFDSLEKAFEEAITELQVRENGLDSRSNSLAESKQEFDSLMASFESRREAQDRKEAEFDLFQHEYFRAREEMMESRFADIRRRAEERIDDACLKEEMFCAKVDLVMTDIDNRLDDLRVQGEEQEGRWNELLQREKRAQARMIRNRRRSESLRLKEKQNEETRKANQSKGKELDSKIKHFEACFDHSLEEFYLKEQQFQLDKENFDLQIGKLELKQEEFVEKLKEIDRIRELLDEHERELEMERKYYNERKIDNEELLDLHTKELELKQEELAQKSQEIGQTQVSLEQHVKEVELERKHLHDRRVDIGKEKRIRKLEEANAFVQCDPPDVTRFLANMDGRRLLQFLSKHSTELDLMQKDVSNTLKMSSDSGRIVIVAIMEEFQGQNIPTCAMMSILFVLEMLVGNIPMEIIKSPVVLKAAHKVALEWKANLTWKKDPIYLLGFLQLVCTYRLTSEFDHDELYNLCCSVADDCDGIVPELSEILSCSEKDPVSKILNVFQDKIDRPKKAKAQARGTVPDLFLQSSNPASLLLDVMQCCFDSSSKGDMKVFLPLLKEIVNFNIDINIHNIQAEALSLAADWKSKLLFSNTPEALCFLLFLSIYKLGSWFDHDELLCLLINCKSNFSGCLLLNLGLDQILIEFIQNLVAERKQLKAIICIYDFDLMDKFPPVPLLKNYLFWAEAKDNAVEEELIEVQAVIKCIVDRELESLSSLKPLVQRVIELLEEKDGRKKRLAPLSDSNLEARSGKKVRTVVSAATGGADL